jgi:hypothetical protein
MNKLFDQYIINKIYQYVENPKKKYDNVVAYLKKRFKGSCSSNCRFRHFSVFDGEIYYNIILVRQTHIRCKNCESAVSDYSHMYCYLCAPENSLEYIYHHSRCI